MHQYYWFAQPDRKGEKITRHRDSGPHTEIQALLGEIGIRYKKTLVNLPSANYVSNADKPINDARTKPGILNSSDLIVLLTRPALDEEWTKVRLRKSGSELERTIDDIISQYLTHCSRSKVRLSRPLREKLRDQNDKFSDRGDITFFQNGNPWYKSLGGKKVSGICKTTAYLIYVKQVWEEGPSLLCSFSLSGIETWVWNSFLRDQKGFLDLSQSTFIMAELELIDDEYIDYNIDFSLGWKVTPIFLCNLDDF